MAVNIKPTGRAVSIPVGLTYGALTSAGTTLSGTLITAKLIDQGIIGWPQTGYAVMIILMLAAWLGSSVAAGKIKRRKMVICLGSALIYMMLLLCMTALFFGGKYSGVGETALLIFCGSVLAMFPAYPGKRGRKNRKKMTGYR